MKSLRANLLLWLVGALSLGLAGAVVGTYALTRAQVGALFDDELRQVALAVHQREDWIEQGRVRIARPGFFLSVRAYDRSGRTYFETAMPSLPVDLVQTYDEGFSRVATGGGDWRIFTHVTEEGIVQVGQPVATRDALARDLSLRALVPMLLLIPFVAAVIGWALRRGLGPLEETTRRVSHRDAGRLDPLPTDNVPVELRPLVDQINALLSRLSRLLQAERRFLADAAHELRSPIAALSLQVQLAERAQSPAARTQALAELARGIERGRRLVQQLLDFARLDADVAPEPFNEVDLAQLSREVVGTHAARAEAAGLDLGADASAPAPLRGSAHELLALIENLVDNALRYAPRGSAVTVAVRPGMREVELTVTDAGPGIPPAERENVFGRFFRLPGDQTAGSGLGLAIARAIAERHRGSIDLRDAAGGGLLVRVSLPRQAPA